jgi:hypothetical protein
MPRVGGFQSFPTARPTFQGFEAMLWLRKGFGFSGPWTMREQNRLLASASDFQRLTKHENRAGLAHAAALPSDCDMCGRPL